jgi:hypothetical protein
MMLHKPNTFLELDIGYGIAAYVLRRGDIDLMTLDVGDRVKPNLEGFILELRCEFDTLDGVLCC